MDVVITDPGITPVPPPIHIFQPGDLTLTPVESLLKDISTCFNFILKCAGDLCNFILSEPLLLFFIVSFFIVGGTLFLVKRCLSI